MIEPANEQDVKTLRQLYLANSDREALVIHLNTLLESAGWRRDKTVVRLDRPADRQYQVALDDGNIGIQDIERNPTAPPFVEPCRCRCWCEPSVRWDCEPVVGACWVYIRGMAPGFSSWRRIAIRPRTLPELWGVDPEPAAGSS